MGLALHRGRPLLASLGQHPVEIGNRARQPVIQRHTRLPAENAARERNVGTALQWIVLRQLAVVDARARVGQPNHPIGQLADGDLVRVAKVDRTGDRLAGGHQANAALGR